MMCAVCMFDGRRQEDLIDLKDGQIDQLRAERDALAALLRWVRYAMQTGRRDHDWLLISNAECEIEETLKDKP